MPASRTGATSESELAREFWERLRLFATRRLRDPAQAEDIAQETLRRVMQALRDDRLENRAALPAFVLQTARHICLQRNRSARREHRAMSRLRSASSASMARDPLDRLITEQQGARVRRALGRLERDDRELIRLFFYEGRATDEVAVRLDATPGAIRVRKHRALKRLAKALSDESARNESERSGTTR